MLLFWLPDILSNIKLKFFKNLCIVTTSGDWILKLGFKLFIMCDILKCIFK